MAQFCAGSPPSAEIALVDINREEEIQLRALSLLLFNSYMKPVGEIIHLQRTRYHQYADDTQLCISILGEVSGYG